MLALQVDAMGEEIIKMKTELAVIQSSFATKADVSEAKSSIIMWVVSASFFAQLLPVMLQAFKALL